MKVKCTGTSKRTGGPCQNYPIHGHHVCVNHGGRAPQVQRAAAMNLVQADARKALSKLGDFGTVSDPLAVAGALLAEMIAFKDYLRGLMDKIEDERMRVESFGGPGEQMRAELTAYAAALNSTVSAVVAVGKLNIDERLARIDEERQRVVMDAFRAGLAAAGLTGDRAQTAMVAVGKHLRMVKGGRAA